MNRSYGQQAGLTLVEVLLSMAIMAMVLAALAQLQDSGARAALRAALTAEACVLCQAELDAWLAGSPTPAALDTREPIAGTDLWSKRISVQPVNDPQAGGLSLITVEVYRGQQLQPLFTLSRWVATRQQGVKS